MIIPASGSGFNLTLAEALEREKRERQKEKKSITMPAETASALRCAIGRSISYLQNVYEILDAELQGTDFEEDSDKVFREWRKGNT